MRILLLAAVVLCGCEGGSTLLKEPDIEAVTAPRPLLNPGWVARIDSAGNVEMFEAYPDAPQPACTQSSCEAVLGQHYCTAPMQFTPSGQFFIQAGCSPGTVKANEVRRQCECECQYPGGSVTYVTPCNDRWLVSGS
jgi:hypothetical protein